MLYKVGIFMALSNYVLSKTVVNYLIFAKLKTFQTTSDLFSKHPDFIADWQILAC